jgi:rhomboid protease GluP
MKTKANWLTRQPHPDAPYVTAALTLLLWALAFLSFSGAPWMRASGELVFGAREYGRLWFSLFAHGDFGHLAANTFLFVPLTYVLSAYFGPFLLPLLGILLGGLINALVIATMPSTVFLVGISGVVSWMAATWITLFLLIDRRDPLKRRFGAVLFLTLIWFVPEKLKPEVSYLSHFLGYVLGVFSGWLYYLWHQKAFAAAVVLEEPEPDFIPEEDWRQP